MWSLNESGSDGWVADWPLFRMRNDFFDFVSVIRNCEVKPSGPVYSGLPQVARFIITSWRGGRDAEFEEPELLLESPPYALRSVLQ